MKKFLLVTLTIALALALALTACKNDDDGKGDPEQPEYRDGEIVFTFLDEEGDPINETITAKVQGTMLLAEWNNALATVKSKIEHARNITAIGQQKGPFSSVFYKPSQGNATIIFEPNAGNGKLEVKAGEKWNLYINPSALNSITDEELIDAITAMRDGTAEVK